MVVGELVGEDVGEVVGEDVCARPSSLNPLWDTQFMGTSHGY